MLLKQLQNRKKYMISVLYLIAFMEKLTVTLRILLNLVDNSTGGRSAQ